MSGDSTVSGRDLVADFEHFYLNRYTANDRIRVQTIIDKIASF
jgi:hypothetical protein